MYKEDEIVRLKSIHKKLTSIFTIIQRHDGIVNALEDDIEAQPAILMLLVAIAEQFTKLYKKDSNILESFDLIDIKGMTDIRNFISHDYDGVNLALIESILRVDMPKILNQVENILGK